MFESYGQGIHLAEDKAAYIITPGEIGDSEDTGIQQFRATVSGRGMLADHPSRFGVSDTGTAAEGTSPLSPDESFKRSGTEGGRGMLDGISTRFSVGTAGVAETVAAWRAVEMVALEKASENDGVRKTTVSFGSRDGEETQWWKAMAEWAMEGYWRPSNNTVLDFEQLLAASAKLTESPEAFLSLCKEALPGKEEGEKFILDGEFVDWAGNLLEWSKELSAVRHRLVPARIKEDIFWGRWFAAFREIVKRLSAGIIDEEAAEQQLARIRAQEEYWQKKVSAQEK